MKIGLGTTRHSTAAHEAGHLKDLLEGRHQEPTAKDSWGFRLPAGKIPEEVSATSHAFKALGGVDPELAAATGTYLQGALAVKGPRNAPRAMKNLDREFQTIGQRTQPTPALLTSSSSNWTGLHSARNDRIRALGYDTANPFKNPAIFDQLSPRAQKTIAALRKRIGGQLDQQIQPGAGAAANSWLDEQIIKARGR